MSKAIVIATDEQLKSIGIYENMDPNGFKTGVEVKIVKGSSFYITGHGEVVDVEYLYLKFNYSIPVKWLEKIKK